MALAMRLGGCLRPNGRLLIGKGRKAALWAAIAPVGTKPLWKNPLKHRNVYMHPLLRKLLGHHVDIRGFELPEGWTATEAQKESGGEPIKGHNHPWYRNMPLSVSVQRRGRAKRMVTINKAPLWKYRPVGHLSNHWPSAGGRNRAGMITAPRNAGGRNMQRGAKITTNYQYYMPEIPKRVIAFENPRATRTTWLALTYYSNGVMAYHPSVEGILQGTRVFEHATVLTVTPGQWRQLKHVPVGTPICNVERWPNQGGEIARSAGTRAMLMGAGPEKNLYRVMMPSREIRLLHGDCWCTVGQISNVDHRLTKIGKWVKKRWMGKKQKTIGLAIATPHHAMAGAYKKRTKLLRPKMKDGTLCGPGTNRRSRTRAPSQPLILRHHNEVKRWKNIYKNI